MANKEQVILSNDEAARFLGLSPERYPECAFAEMGRLSFGLEPGGWDISKATSRRGSRVSDVGLRAIRATNASRRRVEGETR